MWPFDKVLLGTIASLEKSNEVLIGVNSILERELKKSEDREKILQDKLFEVTGINKSQQIPISVGPQKPINLHKKTSNWFDVKNSLEIKAREEYWNQKKLKEDKPIYTDDGDSVENLEKEIGIK